VKSKRHSKILELIMEYPIDTQEELLSKLNQCGFNVTQATVSRDIKELRLIKNLDADGNYRYSTGARKSEDDMALKFDSIFTQSVYSIDFAGNMVVIKCYTGMANAACAALDSIHWKGVVGTLAGDDTIFVVMRNQESSVEFVEKMKKLLNLSNY